MKSFYDLFIYVFIYFIFLCLMKRVEGCWFDFGLGWIGVVCGVEWGKILSLFNIIASRYFQT